MIQQSLQGPPLQFVVPSTRNFGSFYTTTTGSVLWQVYFTIRDKRIGLTTLSSSYKWVARVGKYEKLIDSYKYQKNP